MMTVYSFKFKVFLVSVFSEYLITTSGDFLGGLTIIEVSSENEAKMWGAKVAEACGWPQEVRKFKGFEI